MTHSARVVQNPETGRYGWDCAQCGAWSRGYRFTSQETARRGAELHDIAAGELDRAIHRSLYGSRRPAVAAVPAEPRSLTVMRAHEARDCPDRDRCWAADIHDKHSPRVPADPNSED